MSETGNSVVSPSKKRKSDDEEDILEIVVDEINEDKGKHFFHYCMF